MTTLFLNGITLATTVLTGATAVDINEMSWKQLLGTLLFGAALGESLNCFVPPTAKEIMTGSLFAFAALSTFGRIYGLVPPPLDNPLFCMVYEDTMTNIRISYTAADVLVNTGPTLEIEQPLNSETVIEILTNNTLSLNRLVISKLGLIRRALDASHLLGQVSSIFIHGPNEGYVLIKGPNKRSTHVMSIHI